MNVLYTCDNNYIWIMGISLISLYENNRDIEVLSVFLLGDNISEENKKVLHNIAYSYQRETFIIDVPKLEIPEALVSKRWPISAFTRLFSADLLPNSIDKVLYLDCDTIVNSSLYQLQDIDMGLNCFYGVKDCIGYAYKKNIGIPGDSTYFNAGVLLINLDKLRDINISKYLETYLNKYTHFITYADQDLLNGAFNGLIGILNAEYDVMTITATNCYEELLTLRRPTNYYTKSELDYAIKNPKIIHYTTNMLVIRPWYNNTNHPFALNFKRYLEISPWKDKKLQDYNFKTKEAKIIKIINLLPESFAIQVLGLIHSELKPRFTKVKAYLKKYLIKE
ncbi:glycosyltransferase family 8 protein [Lacrimispora sp.]|uniref:glycosyltransferase family 8 protein n=1 Tax=Lacrimispora sp. TaxID=2719234 RepID=UPI002FDB4EF7